MTIQNFLTLLIGSLLFSCTHKENKFNLSSAPGDTVSDKAKANQNEIRFEMGKPVFKISNKKNYNPFLLLDFDKVIAFDYEGRVRETYIDIIDSNGVLAQSVTKQKVLTPQEINKVVHLFGDNSTYGEAYAECFDPHLGIVFFKNNKVVAELSICLECNRLSSSFTIPATEVKKIKISDDYEYPAEGFSKMGRRKINSLCKEFNFDHCKDEIE